MALTILLLGFISGAFLYSQAGRLCEEQQEAGRSEAGIALGGVRLSALKASALPQPDWHWGSVGALCGLVSLTLADEPLHAVLGTLYLLTLTALFVCDLNHYRLPNLLTATLLGLGGASGVLHHGLTATLLGAAFGSGFFWMAGAIYLRVRGRPGLGCGDVKMMAGLSAAAGPFGIAWITLLASGGSLIAETARVGGARNLMKSRPVPFGCGLAVAGAILWAVQAVTT